MDEAQKQTQQKKKKRKKRKENRGEKEKARWVFNDTNKTSLQKKREAKII